MATAAGRALSLVVLASLSACGTDVAEQHPMPAGSPEAGLEVIRATGCAACHVVPGVEWPMGRTGPSLEGFAARPLIAGSLSNDPDTLTAFVRNAPALSPESAMPPMPLTDTQARDVAAYLYTLQPR
ncbi:MAG: c-type cytochrome [Brevundimonas sp.]|uniref:c-type cytochrome n=1 Tax=Brevundimonas sp. TaxID=1871086 RepID=UPI00300365ED